MPILNDKICYHGKEGQPPLKKLPLGAGADGGLVCSCKSRDTLTKFWIFQNQKILLPLIFLCLFFIVHMFTVLMHAYLTELQKQIEASVKETGETGDMNAIFCLW